MCFVEKEDIDRDTEISQHPVEKGLPTTDSIRVQPKTLSISGKIVAVGSQSAATIISKIEKLRTSGSLIDYKGRNVLGNYQIKSFNTSDSSEVWGGSEFDMRLVEVRIAKSAYTPKKITSTTKSPNQASSSSGLDKSQLQVGMIVVFKGGSVYVSSDAKNPAATRGRSTCKITIINSRSWAVHQYHLISQDGKKVYGWVDLDKIELSGTSSTASTTNGGTQQVNKS